jgi:hypothetical protein
MSQTITKKYEVFTFDELSEQAKEKAINDYIYQDDYGFQHEDNQEQLKELCNLLDIDIKKIEYEYGYRTYINCKFDINDITSYIDYSKKVSNQGFHVQENRTGLKLYKWIQNNINIYDKKKLYNHNYKKFRISKILHEEQIEDYFIKPLLNFISNPDNSTTWEDIVKDCLETWITTCNKNYLSYYSSENISEIIRENEYVFLSDGKIFTEGKEKQYEN